jgi:glycosyltransferase involved in cell wall biosynthesis
MTLLLYGLTDSGEREVRGSGVEQVALRGISESGLVAIVSERADRSLTREHETLWEYERVIESLMEHHSIVPARFGSVFEHEEELRTMLRDRSAELTESFRRVRDARELALRASWADGGAADPPAVTDDPLAQSGTAYMRARLEQHRRAERLVQALEPLAALARESRRRLEPDPATALSASYLVERDRVDQFIDTVRRLDDELEAVELVLTGPWPPYSFVAPAGEIREAVS